MNNHKRSIEIRGDVGKQSVFLDGIEVHPTSVKIDITCQHSTAILVFEQITIDGEVSVDKFEEFTEYRELHT